MHAFHLQGGSVKVGEAESLAEGLDIGLRLVIARQDVYAFRSTPHRLAHLFQAARPTHQVACGEVVVRVDFHQPIEGADVVVKVGEYKGPDRLVSHDSLS